MSEARAGRGAQGRVGTVINGKWQVDARIGSGGMATVGQLAVFDQCRDKIEAIASQKWDCSQLEDGRVIVKPEDLVKVGFV